MERRVEVCPEAGAFRASDGHHTGIGRWPAEAITDMYRGMSSPPRRAMTHTQEPAGSGDVWIWLMREE
jgi:hypothetical protein